MKKYSVIVPVYNRPNEVEELLDSLNRQEFRDFEILIIEDGSSSTCEDVVKKYSDALDIKYFYKENSGPGASRNYGMDRAGGEYLIFFDSDCLIPPGYFTSVEEFLSVNPLDTFGGPDSAHESFSDTQKAINYAMTSFITTGGIRGKKKQLDKFQPRSFNMGIRKAVYEQVGGFSTIHPGEDPDLSYRIMKAGFKVGLIPDAPVFHKRRIDFKKFIKQVYKFGLTRTILIKWYPDSFKLVYFLPGLFLVGTLMLLILSFTVSLYFLTPIGLLIMLIFTDALIKTKRIKIAFLSILASFIQLTAYGFGFLKGWWNLLVLRRDERKVFPGMFFEK